ncbi:MAG TPA: sensor histidine kinase, partial [Saccharofermentans sp.]|nr:sensor histidine kinase [Saccharofermentans sp.]
NIELKTFFEISGPNEIYGEAQQLCRVMMNVITNAIKFTPMDGKIRIRVFEDHDDPEEPPHLVVTVEDSGPGVPEEKRKRVFESFYQMDSSRRQEGYGLGLYICKQILSAHKQFIFLDESATLGGAMFVFSLPLPPEESEDSSANK